jgi:FtsZ-binding cell division protein ZapB
VKSSNYSFRSLGVSDGSGIIRCADAGTDGSLSALSPDSAASGNPLLTDRFPFGGDKSDRWPRGIWGYWQLTMKPSKSPERDFDYGVKRLAAKAPVGVTEAIYPRKRKTMKAIESGELLERYGEAFDSGLAVMFRLEDGSGLLVEPDATEIREGGRRLKEGKSAEALPVAARAGLLREAREPLPAGIRGIALLFREEDEAKKKDAAKKKGAAATKGGPEEKAAAPAPEKAEEPKGESCAVSFGGLSKDAQSRADARGHAMHMRALAKESPSDDEALPYFVGLHGRHPELGSLPPPLKKAALRAGIIAGEASGAEEKKEDPLPFPEKVPFSSYAELERKNADLKKEAEALRARIAELESTVREQSYCDEGSKAADRELRDAAEEALKKARKCDAEAREAKAEAERSLREAERLKGEKQACEEHIRDLEAAVSRLKSFAAARSAFSGETEKPAVPEPAPQPAVAVENAPKPAAAAEEGVLSQARGALAFNLEAAGCSAESARELAALIDGARRLGIAVAFAGASAADFAQAASAALYGQEPSVFTADAIDAARPPAGAAVIAGAAPKDAARIAAAARPRLGGRLAVLTFADPADARALPLDPSRVYGVLTDAYAVRPKAQGAAFRRAPGAWLPAPEWKTPPELPPDVSEALGLLPVAEFAAAALACAAKEAGDPESGGAALCRALFAPLCGTGNFALLKSLIEAIPEITNRKHLGRLFRKVAQASAI